MHVHNAGVGEKEKAYIFLRDIHSFRITSDISAVSLLESEAGNEVVMRAP